MRFAKRSLFSYALRGASEKKALGKMCLFVQSLFSASNYTSSSPRKNLNKANALSLKRRIELKSKDNIEYNFLAALYFLITFTLIGFAMVAIVQGIKFQFGGETLIGFLFYFAAPLLIFVSYLSYQKAHYKLNVIALAHN